MPLNHQITDVLGELADFFPNECSHIRADLEFFAFGHKLNDERVFNEQKKELLRLIKLNIIRVRQAAVSIQEQLQSFGVESGNFAFSSESTEAAREVASDTVQVQPEKIVILLDAPDAIENFMEAISSHISSMRYEPPSPNNDPSTDSTPPTVPSL